MDTLKFPLKEGLLSPPLPYQKYCKAMQTLAPLQIFMAAFFCFAPELQAHGLDLQSNIQALS